MNQSFNPNEHLMKIGRGDQAKDYLPVQWRLVWFRSLCPEGTIDTEEIEVDLDRETEEEVSQWNQETRRMEKVVKRARGYARFRAVVTDGKGGRATGTKSERAASFPDYIEKAETGAIGRALAALGYGTQFTGDEFDEQHRIVDAPVEQRGQARPSSRARTEQAELAQKREIARRMAQTLGLKEPPPQMDEKALDDFIAGCKRENAARKQAERKEAEARAELTEK